MKLVVYPSLGEQRDTMGRDPLVFELPFAPYPGLRIAWGDGWEATLSAPVMFDVADGAFSCSFDRNLWVSGSQETVRQTGAVP